MTSSRPYLIRALYQWIVDNGVTPYILVDASVEGVNAPEQYVQDGKIVLNIAPMAVRSLVLADEHISFNARFGGHAMDVFVPVSAVLAIFNDEPRSPEPPKPGGSSPEEDASKPKLRIVK
jgi:stringent starvation protein B